MKANWEDPVSYAYLWAEKAPIDVPQRDQKGAAILAVSFHGTFLYDNPLAEKLRPSERNRFVREQFAAYQLLLETYGVIKTIVKYKEIAHQFLRSFLVTDFGLFYMPDEDITYTPMYRSAMTLAGRVLDIHGADGHTIWYILSWLLYLSKVPLDRPDLIKTSETEWLEVQVNPKPVHGTPETFDVLRRIVAWLIEVEPNFVGNHGPGSTAGGAKTVPDKNRNFKPTLQSQLLTRFSVDEVPRQVYHIEPCERIDVAKDIGSLRSITKEPVATQFAQQGLKFDIYNVNDYDPDCNCGYFIRYNDQRPSQDCAVRGSVVTRDRYKPSTIDLRRASDRLSVDLVIQLFSGNLLHYLMLGRSWDALVGKRRVELAMYGGMGSALTFPVQSIIFTACAIWATISAHFRETLPGIEATPDNILMEYLRTRGFARQHKNLQRSVRVYGDDITVPDFAAEDLFLLLEDLGLEVNVSKSFIGASPVRESCGMYALGGRDITPMRYRIPVLGKFLDAAGYEALRAHANLSFQHGCKWVNRAAIRRARDSQKFMSRDEYRRTVRKGKRYPDQKQGIPELLFEEDRGNCDYIGFRSTTGTIPNNPIDLHERVLSYTTYVVESETTRDEESDFYHLTVNYRQMDILKKDSIEAHGSVPRGVRLRKRNAVRLIPNQKDLSVAWGWAPR